MSLLLDALKKAAEQKAKKGKKEAPDAPAADSASGDETDLESLLGRASDSTQTAIGEPNVPLDDGDLSMPQGPADSTEVRDPQSLARSALGDDTDLRRPDELAESIEDDDIDEDRIEFADTGEFAETLLDEDRDRLAETGSYAEAPVDEDSTDFADTGKFAETLLDEDQSDFVETRIDEDQSDFVETLLDEERTDFGDTGEYVEILADEDRTEFGETGDLGETLADEERTDFGATGEYVEALADEERTDFGETLVDEDRTEFDATGDFGETLVDRGRTDFDATGRPGEMRAEEDLTEVGAGSVARAMEQTEIGATPAEDRTGTRARTDFVDTDSEDATDLGAPSGPGETRAAEPGDDGARERHGISVDTTDYTVDFEADADLRDDDDLTDYTRRDATDVTGIETLHDADETAGMTTAHDAEDQTDTRLPSATLADLERRDGDDTTGVGDEDMSLLLVDEPTGLTRRSRTDPRGRDEALRALEGEAGDGLSLVDTTRHRVPVDRARNLGSGSPTTTSMDTQTQGGDNTTRRGDGTYTAAATTTYAPDNYDRTLMRLPSSDASNLFAGMKAEGDVVMTPDYAKKVFRSKSTAQRWQHLRIYGAIGLIILIGIGIYGTYEYQGQSENIDASLRPLKRDPMPGLIKPETSQTLASLFADPEQTERTIEIIESADRPDSGEIAADNIADAPRDTADAAAGGAETAVAAVGVDAPSGDSARPAATPASAPGGSGTSEFAAVEPAAGAAAARPAPAGGSTLQITTSSRLEERDVWLRGAYRAYQAGNDDEAIDLYNRVLAEYPGNRDALLGRAAINVHNNRTAAAMQDYRRLLEANPKDSLAMTSLLAVANLSPVDTESQLKLMIRDEPDSPYLNFALANAYGAQRRWREAQGHYFIALQNNPGDPNYAYNLAVSLEHIQQPGAAVAYYRRALENFDNGLATFNRDLVRQRMEVLENL